jgi:N-acetylmuramoyl-L-alanine amidase
MFALRRGFVAFSVRLLAAAGALAALAATTPARSAPAYDTVRLFGTDYVDARDFGARYGLSAEWIAPREKLRLRSQWTTIELTADSIDVSLNGVRLFLAAPVVARNGSLYLGEDDIAHTLGAILSPKFPGRVPAVRTIAVDAGHGGNDPGNQNKSLKLDEKVYTLDVARRLERLLKRDGFRVVMTRTRDRAVGLEERTAVAARAGADVFVSIHFNSFTQPGVAGAETYVMTPRGQRSSPQAERDDRMVAASFPSNRHDLANILLGYQVHRHLIGELKPVDRGLKHFRYSVLRTAECPAVLVEAAFLSNPAEGRKVATAAYRQQIAAAIASGIKAHAEMLDRLRSGKG